MELMDAIYTRRSIRKYKEDQVPEELINKLLEAAIQAPSATNSQPWVFAVIQDKELLKNYSDRAKALLLSFTENNPNLERYRAALSKPEFNIFYNANTFLIIYSTAKGSHSEGDCCLAAQNLMLTAHAHGLGTCWIGFSLPFLNTKEAKDELGIPENYTAVAPLVLGYPEVMPSATVRTSPQVIAWKK